MSTPTRILLLIATIKVHQKAPVVTRMVVVTLVLKEITQEQEEQEELEEEQEILEEVKDKLFQYLTMQAMILVMTVREIWLFSFCCCT